MRLVHLALAPLVALAASGCFISVDGWGGEPAVRGSGVRASVPREHGEFRAVEASGSFELELEQGEPREVVVSGDDNLLELLETRVDGGTLRLRTTRGYSSRLGLRVFVRAPRLESVGLSGSHEAQLRGLAGGRLELRCSGSNELRASGEVDRLDVSLSGSTEVDLEHLVAREVRVTASGSSELSVHASELLDLELSGSSEVRYAGAPRVQTSQSGSSSVRRID